MSDDPVMRLETELPSMVRVDGLWVHQGMPEEEADWLSVVDQVREERAQAVMCLDVPTQGKD